MLPIADCRSAEENISSATEPHSVVALQVEGPAVDGATPLDARARTIFQYFKNYNYEVAGTGEVIKFVGNYRASKGQAAALILYTFLGARGRQAVCSADGSSAVAALQQRVPCHDCRT